MVHVINHYTQGLQVIMDDKTGKTAQEKKNDQEFLPSMGLGAFVRTADDTAALMSQIRQSDGANFELPKKSVTKPSNGMAGSARNMKVQNLVQKKGNSEPKPGTSRDYYKGNQHPISGNTMPLTSSTINMEDITDDYDTKSAIFSAVTEIPQLSVKTAEYARFRYASERPEKGKKIRQYEMDEDKRLLADIKVTNYRGSATVIMHCVNSDGHIHPYHLDGDDCVDGVYYKQFEFSPRSSTLRITKTIVIQPKAKAYKESLADQEKFLKQMKAFDGKEKKCETPQDKQCVHFHVKVFLDNGSEGSYLNTITSAVRNKKDGTEFKIHTLTPPSAKVNAMVLDHLGQKVYIIVTNETAFPKNVGVVFRNPRIGWEKILKGDDIKVIKKAVIELTPPQYADTTITENVEVDVSLRDESSGKETEPAKFLYIGDEYGVHAKKSKKRKIEDVEGFSVGDYMPVSDVTEQRKVLHALRTRNSASPVGSYEAGSSDDNTPHNSLGFEKDNNMVTGDTTPIQPADSPQPVNDVSLEDRRTNRSAGTQPAQATATFGLHTQLGLGFPTHTGVVAHNDSQQFVVQPSSQIVTSAESVYTSSVMQSVAGLGPDEMEVNNDLQTQQSGNQAQQSFDPSILDNLSPDMLLRLAENVRQKKIKVIPEFENLMWERVSQVFMPPEENVSLQESSGQAAQEQNVPVQQPTAPSLNSLPALPVDHHYAIIKGQIMVVKDDSPKPSPPVESQPVSIAGQSVIIQSIEPQQPSDLQIPSDLLKSDYFNQLMAQNEAFTATNDMFRAPVTTANQPQQPNPVFWRAYTGATCNLDDDDVEIDSGVYPHTTLNEKANDGIVSNVEGSRNNVDDVNEMETDISPKVHKMKLRGKNIKYKDALREYENVLSDIKESGDSEGEKKSDNNDAMKYLTPKKKYTKEKEKQNQRRGKALYEEDMDNDKDVELKSDEKRASQPKYDKPPSGYGRGKDIKLVKKLAISESDEDSQGFECS